MRILNRSIYQTTSNGRFVRDRGLQDQIRRASVSVVSNIAEGFERRNNREFRRFLAYAKGSIGEVKAHLYIALDVGFLCQKDFDTLFRSADEVARLLSGLIRYLDNSNCKSRRLKKKT